MQKIIKQSLIIISSIIVSILLVIFLTYIISKKNKYQNGEIKIFCWGQYIADGGDNSANILSMFEQETKIKISAFNTFDSTEQMYTKLKNNNSSYDVIFCCDYMVQKLIDEKLIQKIDTKSLKNYENIIPKFKGDIWGYDKTNEYSIPYSWGHVGLIYNKNLVENLTHQKAEDVITGWDCLWDPRLKQNILMFINGRDSFSIAQKLLKNSINTTKKTDILNAADILKKQKPLVQAYVMDEMFDKMENNEAAVCVAYSGDIINMMKNNSNLRYCFPKEGSNLFIDTVCVPTNAQNKDNAIKFLDFLCRDDVAIENAKFLSYSSPIKPAYDFFEKNSNYSYISYPCEKIINSCEIHLPIPKSSTALMENLWVKIRM